MSFLRSKKLITIIISCYNHEKFLEKCLNSLLNQKSFKRSFDIIFIDDGSQDRSLNLARKILVNKKNCKIISNKKNIGLTKSCNKVLKIVNTKYFIRVDSDDFISKNLFFILKKS